MPLFELECPECGARVERIFNNAERADAADVRCTKCIDPNWPSTACFYPPEECNCSGCSGFPMRRVPSVTNFALKGAGFHTNDYPKKDKK